MPTTRLQSVAPKPRGKNRPRPDPHLARQWKILERLNGTTCTVKELAVSYGVDQKTIRRDLLLLEKVGFRLKETVGEFGRKSWRLKDPLMLPPTERQHYRTIGQLLDKLLEKASGLNDLCLIVNLQSIRQRVARKCR